ncbi:MAG: nucleotidyltransferase family protein [Candidatus Sulfotelmatobacter sp.]
MPTASVAPEWKLLLAASSPDLRESGLNQIRLLLAKPVDWDAVLRLAEHHGTSSLLYQNLAPLQNAVPASALASLRQGYERNIHKSLFLARELIRILDCLDTLGIEVVPYKGVVLSEVYYGDLAMRHSGDMDLFVRKQDVVRIRRAVGDLAYTARVAIPEDAEADYIASGYECTFDSPAGKNLLELQWALQPRFYAVDFDMDGLFERAVNVTVAGRRVKTPSPEDLLLVLSVHAAKHVWGRLIWLCDIAQIAKRDNLNWDWVQAQARHLGIERILHITLLLTNRFFATPIPAAIENAVMADRAALAFTEQIAAVVAAGVSYEEEQLSYFWLMMRLRERRMDRLRFLTRLAFTPGPGEWEAVRLPKPLFPLYRVVRLARLAARFAR